MDYAGVPLPFTLPIDGDLCLGRVSKHDLRGWPIVINALLEELIFRDGRDRLKLFLTFDCDARFVGVTFVL